MKTLWQPATVLSISDGRVRLKIDRLEQCERCLRGEGCGAGVFSQLFSRRSSILEIQGHHYLAVGQRVRIGISSQRLLTGSIALYGVPLAGFLVGALIGQAIGPASWNPDASALLGGLLLAALTTWGSWQRGHDRWNPVIEAVSCDAYPDCA